MVIILLNASKKEGEAAKRKIFIAIYYYENLKVLLAYRYLPNYENTSSNLFYNI